MSDRSIRKRPRRAVAVDLPRITLRLDLGEDARIGPGKIRLLEAVADHGSISGAARAVGMSYRQAWKLLDQLNGMFREPLLTGHAGGTQGGGAELTALGADVVRRYRLVEEHVRRVGVPHVQALTDRLRP